MTDTSSASPQKTRGKWFLIGILGLVTVAVLIALAIKSQTPAWDTKSVTVVWSKANEVGDLENNEFRHDAFVLDYALQNNTDHDITIPASATIMQRLTKGGGVLVDFASVAKLSASTFLPARHRAQLSVTLLWGCRIVDDMTKKIEHDQEPESCYAQCFAGSDGLVLFDHGNHLEISLSKPILTNPK